MKPPHARRDPRYWPPDAPPGRLAFDLLVGAAAVVVFFFVLVVLLPVMA